MFERGVDSISGINVEGESVPAIAAGVGLEVYVGSECIEEANEVEGGRIVEGTSKSAKVQRKDVVAFEVATEFSAVRPRKNVEIAKRSQLICQ